MDSSGAVVPDAQVTVTSLETGEKRIQKTSNAGLYSFVDLLPGQYRIVVEKEGFKRVTREPVVVEVQQAVRIDVTLQLGSISQTIEVTAATPLLQPDTSSMGQVVEERAATTLPLNGRNIFNLIALGPSVVPQGGSAGTPVGQNAVAWANYQINGSFGSQSAEYMDGEPLNTTFVNGVLLVPTQDSIQEFKIQTSNLGPEWGKLSGGVVNLSTKSGTNSVHGEVYEYLRNKVLNANYDYINSTSVATPPWTQNQFGANAGGPLVLPGYNGRNKSFWFGSWEGFRLRTASPFTLTVPTPAEKLGDFSAIPTPVLDPCGGTVSGPQACPTYVGPATPFPTPNVIPTARLNPASTVLATFWPAGNAAGSVNPATGILTNNYVVSTPYGGDQNEYVGRFDQNISENQRLFVRYTYWNVMNLPTDPLGTGLCYERCTEHFTSNDSAAGYNWSISPTTVLNINASLGLWLNNRVPKNAGYDLTKLGWPATYNAVIPSLVRTPPTPCVLDFADSIICSQGAGSAIHDAETIPNLSPSVTMIRGRHTLQFGGQLEEVFEDWTQTNLGSGAFDFCSPAAQCFTGNPYADFMLGYADNPSVLTDHYYFGLAILPASVATKQTYRALYFGDTWKVTHKLTLNLGLRYEVQGPWSERFNRLSYFDATAPNWIDSATGYSGPQVNGDVFLVNPNTRHVAPTPLNNWSPRIGLAYSVTPKTVVRAAYGIFWIPNYLSFALQPASDMLNAATSAYIGTINGTAPANTIGLPFGPNGPPPPFGRSLGTLGTQQFMTQITQSIAVAVQNNPPGYVQQWNFNLQQELPAHWFASAAYVGSRGVHLPGYSQPIDQLSDSYLAQAAAGTLNLTALRPNPFFVNGQSLALSGPMTTVGQMLRPYPQYTGVALAGEGAYFSEYNSFQLTLERRFARAGSLLIAYTNQKLISDTDQLVTWLESGVGGIEDNNNLRGERSLASQDVPQRLVVSYVLDLPLGHGKKYLAGVTGAANKLVSGWGLDGVTTFQRGFPLLFTGGNATTTIFGGGTRPNVVPGCNTHSPLSGKAMVNEWFNTACFVAPPNWTFGDESRADPTLRANGINNWDVAVFKRTNFGPSERMGLEFRAEFFNLFNHPQYGPPNTQLGSATFGEVNSVGMNYNPRLIQFALKFLF
jgi:hypothetical protein